MIKLLYPTYNEEDAEKKTLIEKKQEELFLQKLKEHGAKEEDIEVLRKNA